MVEAHRTTRDDRRSPTSRLDEAARRLLERNARVGEDAGRRYRYTAPSPDHYPFQWLWDSCFHAIVWSRYDWRRAAEELEGLFAFQSASGHVPHVVFWDHRRVSRIRWHYLESRVGGNRLPVGRKPRRTFQIQPPFFADAVERIVEAGGGDRYARRMLPRLVSAYRFLADERDPDDDGLISVISQFETGLDFSPAWGAPRRVPRDPVRILLYHRVPQVLHKLRRFDLAAIFARDHHQESVLVNVAYGRGLRALARLAGRVGDDDLRRRVDRSADRVTQTLLDRCYDERLGLFFDLAGREERRDSVKTVASLSPLALPDLPAEVAERLVQSLVDRRRFWTRFPVPSVAVDEPCFSRSNRVWGFRFIWRGASSMNTNWLLVRGLREHGYDDVADELATRSRDLVTSHGFNEFYDPIDGTPVGEPHFGWATLAVDL